MQNLMSMPLVAKIVLVILAVVVLIEGAYIAYASSALFASEDASESTCQAVVGKWEKDNPEIAAAKEVYTGEAAEVDFDDARFPRAREQRTAITNAVKDGADFAGHYAVAQWGCGTQCQEQAVIDMKTGKIIAFGLPSEAGVGTHEQYSVLVTNPAQNMPKPEDLKRATFDTLTMLMNIPREYYVLANNGDQLYLKKLCTENPYSGVVIE